MIFSFLLGLLAGWGGYWYVDHNKFEAWCTKQKVMNHVEAAAQSLEEKFNEMTSQAVKEQLADYGVYVVEKAKEASAVVVDASTDARITATIKAGLLRDPGLSGMKINVDTAEGVVTLSGSVRTTNELHQAVQIAVGTHGVQRIISTLQVKPEAPKSIR